MSKRLKFNVKNVISGWQNLSDLITGQESRHHHGFSRLVLPRSIPLCRSDCKCFKQNYLQRSTLNFPKNCVLASPSEGRALTKISSKILLSGKCPDRVDLGSVCAPPAQELPRESPFHFYYDKKKPQCPPAAPEPCSNDGNECDDVCEDECPPQAALPPKPNPCGTQKASPKTDPCSRKMSTFTVPLNIYRFSSRCGKKGSKGKGGGKGPICPPQKKPPDCSGGAKKKGGNICPPPKKVKGCPPKGKGRGGKGSVCPPLKKVKDCPPKGKGGRGGSICPPPKKVKGCPPKRGAGGAKGGKRVCGKPKLKKSGKCGPKKSSKGGGSGKGSKCRPKGSKPGGGGGGKASRCRPKGSKSGGGGSGRSCRPTLKKPRPCSPKQTKGSKKGGSQCGSKKPQKPKCK